MVTAAENYVGRETGRSHVRGAGDDEVALGWIAKLPFKEKQSTNIDRRVLSRRNVHDDTTVIVLVFSDDGIDAAEDEVRGLKALHPLPTPALWTKMNERLENYLKDKTVFQNVFPPAAEK